MSNKHSQKSKSGADSWADETLAIRGGFERSQYGEHSEPIMATSSYVYGSAAEAAARFSGETSGPIYSRFTNPTVQIFEHRLAALEGGEACIGAASGMAATATLLLGTLRQGDEIVATRNMFGSTVNLFKNFLPRYGITVHWADGLDVESWVPLVTSKTKLLYVETPTNPLTELADIRAFADLAHAHGAVLAVDNCFCTPALQKPLALGADIVVHSATKYLDGQGRCVGGAVVGSQELIDTLTSFMRSAGPCMSPFNAWVFIKGLETLNLRMQQHCANAAELAVFLESHPAIRHVYYPGLDSHPSAELAKRQQKLPGGILSMEVDGDKAAAWRLIDAVKLCSITGNLGDARTTITHPATTTHGRMTAEDRSLAGIGDGLIRLAVGLEDLDDIRNDLEQALDKV
ncbi:O-succinylhomoserine sulfhydrylase [Granulosicoccus antarcticus]|uniref:O-succinylhomoserine sulfhydrylase n=1 Tax=Granulosicoccus antarcticus IMCC3135 TaxID=1192854 RepID=A0A2Z2NVR1_9GAMM|nr:O-succinylhomoserine sulfhydrylase [Granulosicoccus antarcticus]ASJ75323.1 O-succinylhomoserine sulfhydrylase [Granulosicoccus antarcticus IMCC3135]